VVVELEVEAAAVVEEAVAVEEVVVVEEAVGLVVMVASIQVMKSKLPVRLSSPRLLVVVMLRWALNPPLMPKAI
jgi:hypothetical protein